MYFTSMSRNLDSYGKRFGMLLTEFGETRSFDINRNILW